MRIELTQEGIRFHGVSNLDTKALDHAAYLGEKILMELGLTATGFSGNRNSCLVEAKQLALLEYEEFEAIQEQFERIKVSEENG